MAFPDRIATARLVLHRWQTDQHLDGLAAVNAQPAAVAYLNEGVPYTREESERQSDRFAAHWATHGYGLCAVELRSTGEIIGFVGIAHPGWFPDYAHEVEAGWRLNSAHWGHGYATEAARTCVDLGFSELGLDRIISLIDPRNAPSIAVARRLGMAVDVTVPHPQRPGDLMIWQTRRRS
jgi:RimJ/RimL family protein N-acetyltransferase